MDDRQVFRILGSYGYRDVQLLAPEKGYRNESHPFREGDGRLQNLILYKRESGSLRLIRNADRAAQQAARHGLPAREIANSRIVRLQAGNWIKYGAIYTYLPGHTIPWEAYTKDHLKLLGACLSNLHYALNTLPATSYDQVADQYNAIVHTMRHYFQQTGVQHAL